MNAAGHLCGTPAKVACTPEPDRRRGATPVITHVFTHVLTPVFMHVIMLLLLVACGGDGAAPIMVEPPDAISTIQLSPTTAALTVGQTTTLSATVRLQSGAVVTTAPITWTAQHPGIANITGSTTGSSVTVAAIAPGTATFSARVATITANATVTITAAAPVARDFQIANAQWTQGVQAADGSIPMVLNGNAAVLNVVMSATGAAGTAGQLALTLTASNGSVVHRDTVVLGTVSGTAASFANPSAQFLVPATVLRDGLKWQVTRDPKHIAVDDSAANDVFPRTAPATMATVTLPPLRIRFVPITLTAHGNVTGNVSPGNVSAYLPTVSRIVPYGELQTSVATTFSSGASFGAMPSGGEQQFWVQLLGELDVARVADNATRGTYWLGVVAPPAGFTSTAFGGFSFITNSPSASGPGTRTNLVVQTGWFNNTGQTADLVAHELGHAFGRRHSPCGGPSGVDGAYPYPDGRIGVAGHDVRSWATGAATRAEVKVATIGDVMGYCFPQWASPYTYGDMLLSRLFSEPFTEPAPVTANASAQHVVVVRGHIADGHVVLQPTVTLTGFPTIPPRADATALVSGRLVSPLRIELVNTNGAVVASQSVLPTELDHAPLATFVTAIALNEDVARTLHSVRVKGRVAGATVSGIRERPVFAFDATVDRNIGSTSDAVADIVPSPQGTVTIRCRESGSAAMVVQDHATGAVLAVSATASTTLPASSVQQVDRLDISCSDGVRSTRRLRASLLESRR
jgi:hypothetical protein